MKIEIPKVIVAVDMADYASELAGQKLFCWVNLPLKVIEEYSLILTDMYEEEFERTTTPSAAEAAPPPNAAHLGEEKETVAREFKEYLARKREVPVERMPAKRLGWFVQVLSQGPERTHWTLDELTELEERDPGFLAWMISTYWNTRGEHLSNKKKS